MLTAIRSRALSALKGVAALLVVAIVVVGIVFAVERFWPSQANTYQSYIYQSYNLYVIPEPPWHPGQSLSLQWAPIDAMGSSQPPRSIACHFALYGPYATQAAAQAHTTGPELGSDAPLADILPPLMLSTDMGAPMPRPVAYTLPPALEPGYYVVAGSTDLGDQSAGGASVSWVAEVAA